MLKPKSKPFDTFWNIKNILLNARNSLSEEMKEHTRNKSIDCNSSSQQSLLVLKESFKITIRVCVSFIVHSLSHRHEFRIDMSF